MAIAATVLSLVLVGLLDVVIVIRQVSGCAANEYSNGPRARGSLSASATSCGERSVVAVEVS